MPINRQTKLLSKKRDVATKPEKKAINICIKNNNPILEKILYEVLQ
ncbi:hypothetical protein FB1_16070 [Flavobacterium branchiophilum NBRC 15030 = ATCC 35035]|nr:hypothetical protein FB1_16070 [Flavobacterium branchiophilum NBRC 15030 = ATCC 35035]